MPARAKKRDRATKPDRAAGGTDAAKKPRSPSLMLARALADAPSATPTIAQLARALGWTVERTTSVAMRYRNYGRVECWRDPDDAGQVRIMLAAKLAERLGLELSDRGDRWVVKAG